MSQIARMTKKDEEREDDPYYLRLIIWLYHKDYVRGLSRASGLGYKEKKYAISVK
ncbi:hypothetical protein AVEN_166991-1, partial [Araneus ventricosus]